MFPKVGKESGKEWFFLLVSVLLAAVVWFVYSLSLSYNVYLDYPVSITTDLPGFESKSNTDQRVIVRVKTDGFYIIDRKLLSFDDPLEIVLDGKFLTPSANGDEKFVIDSRNIAQEVSNALGNNVYLEYVVTDSLTVHLNRVATKKVPVAVNLTVECAPQYRQSSPVSVTPDSIYISGDESLISSIDSVWTESVSYTGIRNNVEGFTPVNKIKGVEFSSAGVVYSFNVSRYVEDVLTLPVVVRNLPSDKKIVLLPDRVDVKYVRFYPINGELSAEDFECSVDYEDFISTPSLVTVPTITENPVGTADFRTDPEVVECIILDR